MADAKTIQTQLNSIMERIGSGTATPQDFKDMSKLSRELGNMEKEKHQAEIEKLQTELDKLNEEKQAIIDKFNDSTQGLRSEVEEAKTALDNARQAYKDARENYTSGIKVYEEVRNENLEALSGPMESINTRLEDLGVKRSRRTNVSSNSRRASITVNDEGNYVWQLGEVAIEVDPTGKDAKEISEEIVETAQNATPEDLWTFGDSYIRSVRQKVNSLGGF